MGLPYDDNQPGGSTATSGQHTQAGGDGLYCFGCRQKTGPGHFKHSYFSPRRAETTSREMNIRIDGLQAALIALGTAKRFETRREPPLISIYSRAELWGDRP